MKKKKIKFVLIVILVIAVLTGIILFIKFNANKKNNVLDDFKISDENVVDEDINYEFPESTIGVLKIPKINVEAEIREGTANETLKKYIGHFTNTPIWNGNVTLASHNRGLNVAHYFGELHLLDERDEIIYITNMGERRYQVYSKKNISSTDWSVTENTEENTITLITCVKNSPKERFCVKGRQI